ncbi:MAG TPA: hypothetical protein DCG75_19540 [Bacteroidales bacterium]|jgi:hypothetical protein|nr:hypothetical protein [Bacteroidales bacterium]
MDLKKIKTLLENYYNGDTTKEEEIILREYLSNENIDNELIADKDIFLFQIHQNMELNNTPDISEEIWNSLNRNNTGAKKENKNFGYIYLKIAASIIILVGSYFILKTQVFNPEQETYFTDTYDNPEIAYQQAKETLLYVSALLNNGTSHLEPIQKINESTQNLKKLSSFNYGLNELSPINTYDLANKYFKQ